MPGSERIFGTGEMAERVRRFAWSGTSLGPIAQWPDELVWSLNSMLENGFPASVLWGPDLLHFYNDAYLPLIAEKHPALMGQPAAQQWAEAWHIIGPQFAGVLERGETLFQQELLVPVLRAGVVTDAYWTYSYSAVRARTGAVQGVMVVCQDVTGERLLRRERDGIAADLERVFNSISDGVLVLDNDWIYTYFNEQGAALIGMRREDLIGKCVWEIFPAAAGTRFYEGYHRAVETQQPVHFDEFYPAPLDKWLECHCFPTQQGLTVYFRDITERKRSEAATEESEGRLAALVDSIPALAWMANGDGWIFWYNRRWYEYTGTTPEQVEGWGWQSVHDPAVLPDVLAKWKVSLETGCEFEMIFPLQGADGVLRNFLTRMFPLKNAAGAVTRWFGINTEIDELERTRQELAKERGQLNAVLENVPVGLVFADATGRLTGGNAEAERILRHPVLHSASVESYDEYVSYHPDGRLVKATDYPLARTLMDGQTHSGEYLYRRGDGTLGWVIFSSAAIRNREGQMLGAVCATLDIDERKRAQEELREKNELFELAEAGARAGFWQYYPHSGRCSLSSGSQQLFGLEEQPMVDVSAVMAKIHPEDRERVAADLQAALSSGVYQSTFRTLGREDEVCWLSGQARVLKNPQGELYFAGFNLDISLQHRAEEALRKSEKLAVAGRLAATISHEINNPLESVTNLLYILRTGTGEEHTRQYVLSAEEELARVSEIVTHSLRFHRSSSAPTLEQLSSILDSAAAIYKSRLLTGLIRIERDYRDQTQVWCFCSELRQVFGNFIGNAFDAIRTGGTIILRTRNATGQKTGKRGVRVTVADTGCGMDAQTIRRIAEPFFTTKGANGTGLGLWISRDILKKHDATLCIRSSRKEGQSGSVFSVFVPVSTPERIAEAARSNHTFLRGEERMANPKEA